jgi:predicted AlkP superfamily phosphohydrolase/phosphomutase
MNGREQRVVRAGQRLICGVCVGLLAFVLGCGGRTAGGRRVIVLGFDGLDYELTKSLIDSGRLPNFRRLAESGGFAPLGTTIPPQSPVAWSTFITGLDPGGHGIFDFIHRDPQTMLPYFSTSKAEGSSRTLSFGDWQIPLSGGSVELLRRGQPFWEVLEDRGIETTIVRMPANFPPSGSATRELSGMGTPDLLGTYGTFSFYTSEPFAFGGRTLSGGSVYPITPQAGVVRAALYGPDNPFRKVPEKIKADFTIYIDAERGAAKFVVGSEERLLKVGEWSDWVPVDFDLRVPTQSVRGICRFYLRRISPDVEVYVTPINLDPEAPALPVSVPDSYAAELAAATGRFYTQGMPEDTKSLREGVFTREEFLTQARMAGDENRRQYGYTLNRFTSGLLFYYFGNVDQIAHMMFRARDASHPARDPKIDPQYAGVIDELYVGLDRIVGETLAALGADDTLIVLSDHGFTSWRRAFHLNGWLREQGYLTVANPAVDSDPGFLLNVDWTRTRAYGLGLNGLYLNVQGREMSGTVAPADRERLLEEIAAKLLATIDPKTGERAVTKVYRREQVYSDAGYFDRAPDLVVGYAKGTRVSDQSAAGSIPRDVIVDNTDAWSGDHCMDHEAVPGVVLSNRPLRKPAPSLDKLAAAILAEFGVEEFPVRRSAP